jgi:DAK2 domain fusion protein YloV
MTETLDPVGLRRAMEIFLQGLRAHREEIDSLNVFPVPDADTGTNMVLTQEAVVVALADADPAAEGFRGLAARIADASLIGARGNAGAILAQVLRALAERLAAAPAAATPTDLASALERAGVDAATAVARPVEGTALTVMRDAAAAAVQAAGRGDGLGSLTDATVAAARASLARTRETNPELRRAGVVDAGGKGIVLLLDAVRAAVEGTGLTEPAEPLGPVGLARDTYGAGPAADGVYEVQFLMEVDETGSGALRDALASLGDSVVVAGGNGLYRAHVHTRRPEAAVDAGRAHGPIRDVAIVDLALGRDVPADDATRTASADDAIRTASAVVALAEGPGLASVLSSLGAVAVPWDGDQPPPEDRILEAIRSALAESVLVVPGHEAAEPATRRAVTRWSGDARVLAGVRSAPAAIAAVTAFNPEDDADRNASAMVAAAGACRDGALTAVASGWVGRADGADVSEAADPGAAMVALAGRLDAAHADVLTVIVGEGVPPADRDAVATALRAAFPRATVDVLDGGQRCSAFLAGVE